MVHPPRRVRPPPYAGRRPGQEQARRSQDRGAPACYAAAMKRSTFSAVSAGHSTAIGAAAILMWAGLAPLAVLAGPVPPFETIAIAFAIAALLGAAGAALRGRAPLGAL